MNDLRLAGIADIEDLPVIETFAYARKRHPQRRNRLDALCDRYQIERGHRELHGALLDSELLAEVYLAMTGGRQFPLGMGIPSQPASSFVQLPEQARGRDEQADTFLRTPRWNISYAGGDFDRRCEALLREVAKRFELVAERRGLDAAGLHQRYFRRP